MLDGIEANGPESLVNVIGAELGTWGLVGVNRLMSLLGGINTDVNAEINDFSPGIYLPSASSTCAAAWTTSSTPSSS